MKVYESRIWLHQKYIIERKTIMDIAAEAKCSHMTIKRYLEKYGLLKK